MCPFCFHDFAGNFNATYYWMGVIMMIVFFLVPILFFYFIGKQAGWFERPEGKEKSALQIVEERFAKGEIDQKEFEERRKLLR